LLVSKNKATSLQKSERKTLVSFLLLYSFFAVVILSFSAFIYYNLQKDVMLSEQNSRLKEYSDELIIALRELHENFIENAYYPRSEKYNSAIYDSSYKEIFSTLDQKKVDLDKHLYVVEDKIHYVRVLERYYLGTMYLVVEISDNEKWLSFFKMKVLFYGLALFLILLIAGYFLLKLLLKPMRESLYLLDRFIKDTTHELNTPVSAILMNIETIPRDNLDEKSAKKIHRIDIAARTISNIYNDLTYVALKNQVESKDERINLTELLQERAEFFKVISTQKGLTCDLKLQKGVFIMIDRAKISRLIDNLISNAIKYNKKGGKITIYLEKNFFMIEDTGIGMQKREIKEIFERYSRFNKSEGGFGIGLNIVSAIASEYDLEIDVDSTPKVGTKVKISW
jgi:two-component system OmpR family sensor kinase